MPAGPDLQGSMLEALDATRQAIHHYAAACRAIQRLPHPSLAAALLELNIRRLEALESDLGSRTRPQASVDGLYTGLNVVHAGLLSLADASGRLRHIYRDAMPVAPPAVGWFIDEEAERTPKPAEAADPASVPGLDGSPG